MKLSWYWHRLATLQEGPVGCSCFIQQRLHACSECDLLLYLAAAARALKASRCLATSEGRAMSAHAFATTSGGNSKAADAVLLAAHSTRSASLRHAQYAQLLAAHCAVSVTLKQFEHAVRLATCSKQSIFCNKLDWRWCRALSIDDQTSKTAPVGVVKQSR